MSYELDLKVCRTICEEKQYTIEAKQVRINLLKEDILRLKDQIKKQDDFIIELREVNDRLISENNMLNNTYKEMYDRIDSLQTKIETIVEARDKMQLILFRRLDEKDNQINALLSVVTQQHYLIKEYENEAPN